MCKRGWSQPWEGTGHVEGEGDISRQRAEARETFTLRQRKGEEKPGEQRRVRGNEAKGQQAGNFRAQGLLAFFCVFPGANKVLGIQ